MFRKEVKVMVAMFLIPVLLGLLAALVGPRILRMREEIDGMKKLSRTNIEREVEPTPISAK